VAALEIEQQAEHQAEDVERADDGAEVIGDDGAGKISSPKLAPPKRASVTAKAAGPFAVYAGTWPVVVTGPWNGGPGRRRRSASCDAAKIPMTATPWATRRTPA
jgi:hypothetical protein